MAMFINGKNTNKEMQSDEKRVILIAFVVLLLGFFSTSFTGLHHAGVTRGASGFGEATFNQEDLVRFDAIVGQEGHFAPYDLNKNSILDEEDRDTIIEKIKLNRPRVRIRECEEGETRCSQEDESTILICQLNELDEPVFVQVPCPERGMKCFTSFKSKRFRTERENPTAYCDYEFKGSRSPTKYE